MSISIISLLKDYDKKCVDCYDSLYNQNSKEFEHIIIYKNLSSAELKYLQTKYVSSIFLKEPDNKYKNKFFALNFGIQNSNKEYVMVLHSDDTISDFDLISKINQCCIQNPDFISVGINILNSKNKVLRKWVFKNKIEKFSYSNIPPHTGFIYKKNLHDIYGLYSLNFPISGDFDFMIKYFSNTDIKNKYINIPDMSISMSYGGDSTNINNLSKVFYEDYMIFKTQKKSFPFIRTIFKKLLKIGQFI